MANNQFKTNYQLKAKVQACLSKNFLRIPKSICGIKVLSSTKLNLPEKIILSEIVSFQAQGRISTIGMRFILKEFNIPSGTASRAINTLLGHQSKKDKKLGIKRPKILIAKPIYWKNSKKKSVRARQLLINPDLIEHFIDSNPSILNKYLRFSHVPNKERLQKVNFERKLIKDKAFQSGTHTKSHNKTGVLQNEAPHKSPLDKGLHASSKNKKYTPLQNETPPFQSGTPTSAYSSSNSNKTNNKAFHGGTPPFHSGNTPFQNGTHAFQSGTPPFHSGTNNITYKNKDKNINKNNSSSSSSSGSSSSDLEDDDDDDDFSNSNSTSNSEMVNSGNLHANGSLHIADNNSHSSLNKATRASVSESNTENEVATSDKGNKDIGKELSPKNEFNRIAVGKLVKAFPKLRQNDNVSDTVRMLIRKYGDEALQKGIEATVVRSGSVRAPIPYLIKLVSNLSKQVAKQNKGKDPNIPCGLTQNQWNMLTWHQKRTDIAQMMIKCHKQGGRAYIESFIKRYNLHETDTKEDKNLPYTNIEEQYMGLINAYEIQRDSLRGGFERKLSAGDENAYKKQYYTFTLARLIEWTAKDYHLDVGNLVITTTISIDFKKEEAKIEQYDSGDISQLSIDEYVYRHYMKHLKLAKLKAKKRDIMDKRQKENLAFYHKKFGNRPFNHNKHDIMKRWASKLPNKVMISIYKQQFNNKSVHQCTTDEIFRLIKNGINDYRSNEKPKVKSN